MEEDEKKSKEIYQKIAEIMKELNVDYNKAESILANNPELAEKILSGEKGEEEFVEEEKEEKINWEEMPIKPQKTEVVERKPTEYLSDKEIERLKNRINNSAFALRPYGEPPQKRFFGFGKEEIKRLSKKLGDKLHRLGLEKEEIRKVLPGIIEEKTLKGRSRLEEYWERYADYRKKLIERGYSREEAHETAKEAASGNFESFYKKMKERKKKRKSK